MLYVSMRWCVWIRAAVCGVLIYQERGVLKDSRGRGFKPGTTKAARLAPRYRLREIFESVPPVSPLDCVTIDRSTVISGRHTAPNNYGYTFCRDLGVMQARLAAGEARTE